MGKDQREIARKLRVLRHAETTGHAAKTCQYFGVGQSSFIDGAMRTGSMAKMA